MNSRYLGAAILAPFLIVLFVGGEILKYGIMILSLVGMYELYNVMRHNGENHPINTIGYALCIIYYITLDKSINTQLVFFIVILTLFILLCMPVLDLGYNFIDVSLTIFAFLYASVFFSFIVLVSNKEHGNYFVWIIFIASWLCDTAAYYTGKYFGKNKLCPKISPKKTIEGSIGGIIGSVIGCLFFGIFINSRGIIIPLYHYIILGFICGVFGQFGDLTASSIKRHAGVKDYSNLIPGHGGILDRFDSILFSSVIVYYYLTFVMQM